jgi:nicotinamide mononucleotide (NMN) deamidase PncC
VLASVTIQTFDLDLRTEVNRAEPMSAGTVAASIAAASGVAAYLNGKYYEELGKSYFIV